MYSFLRARACKHALAPLLALLPGSVPQALSLAHPWPSPLKLHFGLLWLTPLPRGVVLVWWLGAQSTMGVESTSEPMPELDEATEGYSKALGKGGFGEVRAPVPTTGTVTVCGLLYCSGVSCTVMQRTVLYCTVLLCTVLYCTLLYFTLLHCTVLCCSHLALFRAVLWGFQVFYGEVVLVGARERDFPALSVLA